MLRDFLRGMTYAMRGVRVVFRLEKNFRIQVFCFFAVLVVASFLDVFPWEFAAIVLVGTAVLVLECINSAVERLLDLMKPRLHAYVQDIKDIMAAAVLLVSLAAAVIGATILGPYLFGN